MTTLECERTEAGMKACLLGWCVYRAFEPESGQPIRRITKRELTEKARANQNLLRDTMSTTLDVFIDVMGLEMSAQPALMQFLRQGVATELTSDSRQDRRHLPELIAVFLAVKTVVDALDAATN